MEAEALLQIHFHTLLFTQYKITRLTVISSHCLAASPANSGVAKGRREGQPALAALLWGRHYGLCCKGCIETKVVLMSGHYSQLKDNFDFV